VKKYILFDHDGVLVDTEFWYYKAAERALADVGLALDKGQYLQDMNQGLGTGRNQPDMQARLRFSCSPFPPAPGIPTVTVRWLTRPRRAGRKPARRPTCAPPPAHYEAP
jgi:phosphoglycolate phosphatase-like HAD superfamily hydrolase